jgi:aflatoxin B1 aldehyde reductase
MRKFFKLCEETGISSTEASFRWLVHHSGLSDGDVLILGATRVDQLAGNIELCKKGPLEEELVKAVDELWEAVKDETSVTAVI